MKENKILISILVPTYNRVEYLKECLDSIVEQKWFDLNELELIVSDNSEWDETRNFMEKYMKENKDWNVVYNKNKKNLWMVWNRNKLLELKKWEYYIFLSDDDKFYNMNSLRLLYDNLMNYDLDACYWKYRVIDWEWNDKWDFGPHTKIWNNEIYYDSFEEQIQMHSISFWWILYRKFWYRYDYQSKWFSDWTMNLQYLYNNKKVALINEYTLYYRIHDSNDSNTIPRYFDLKFLLHTYNYFNISFWLRIKYIMCKIINKLKRVF